MKTNFELVRYFHDAFGIPNHYLLRQPTPEEMDLRIKLIREEAAELVQALEDRAPVRDIAKEMADVLFVVYGTAAVFGIDLDAVTERVFVSNMSKTAAPGGGKAIKGSDYKEPDLSFLDT